MSIDRVGGVVTKAVVVGRFLKLGERKTQEHKWLW